MTDEEAIKERMASLSTDELRTIVDCGSAEYTARALAIAATELARREAQPDLHTPDSALEAHAPKRFNLPRRPGQAISGWPVTYWILLLTSGFCLTFVAIGLSQSSGPSSNGCLLLAAIGLGIASGTLAVVGLAASTVVSLAGLWRGPAKLRLQLVTWWMVGLGGAMPSILSDQGVDEHPAFLVGGLALAVVLPCLWISRTREATARTD